MPHFFIKTSNIKFSEITITDKSLLKHLKNSLRVKPGEAILFIDENKTQYKCEISEITKDTVKAIINDSYRSERMLNFDLTVAQSVLKSDAEVSALQKATELGVKRIIPIISDNCTIKESIIKGRIDRYVKITQESAKQCERADYPEVIQPLKFDELLKTLKEYDRVIMFSECEKHITLKKHFAENPVCKSERILAVIGPEGGFSEREFEAAVKSKIPQITLGKLIMRADTALTAALFGIINEVENG